MHKQQRNFPREKLNSSCLLFYEEKPDPAMIRDFSHMGVLLQTKCARANKRFVSIVYRNEQNNFVRMLCAVKHITQIQDSYFYGLQFIGIEEKIVSSK